ncbi:adenylate cyclase, family 3 protein [Candidatus Scalindua japonica]|uniref:Adenylate cyclase, family 3 protein n=1 Tax=Candidatus Scalindua japonica TaxID=1284222 RepID=A0A286TUI6_9BACT|nr:adenylate cyclase, family 3 protein [Candidatus Scalindua japonica]
MYSNKLAAINATKREQIKEYFNQVRNHVISLSGDYMIIDAMNQFKRAFRDVKKGKKNDDSKIFQYRSDLSNYYGGEYLARLNRNTKERRTIEQYFPSDDEAIILQYHYIANNLNPTGSKDNLEIASDGSQYSKVHSKYHPVIRDYQKRFGYYDIFLIDEQTGHIVYSVFKEADFATNLLTGPYQETNLAGVFKEVRYATDKEFVKLVDFDFFDPSYADPASFIASPIFDGERRIGVLVFQLPINKINRVMTGNGNWKKEGLAESGETYIVGSDYKCEMIPGFLLKNLASTLNYLKNLAQIKK